MVDHNKWFGIGRLVRDPEYFPATRKAYEHVTFTIAIGRVVPSEEGPEADYIPCSLWGEQAKIFCEERGKGDEVQVSGRIRTSLIPQADGKKQHYWEVRADRVQHGRRSLKNLQPKPKQDSATRAVARLTREFGK
jgi:single-strand DNA-binding protein